MSRFYDVLKRTGGTFPFEEEETGPRLSSVPDVSAPEPVATALEPDLPAPEPPQQPLAAPAHPNGHSERSVFQSSDVPLEVKQWDQLVLNGKVRLIPNFVDAEPVERYRLLRTKILQQQQEKMFRSLLITSPNPKEGKTLTTLNLALTFGLLPGFRVLVVEGDLRKGSMQDSLQVPPRPGLSELIEGSVRWQDAVLKPENVPVNFIFRGKSVRSPAELLHSPRLPALIQELTESFDLVLVDSPPVNLVTDTQIIASCCQAVMLVARALSTSCKAFETAYQTLMHRRVIGAVLNGAAELGSEDRYRRYY